MPAPDTQPWLAFRPRDTLFVRDGRTFGAGSELTAVTVAPWPSTIAGATRSAYGDEPGEVRGPVLARRASPDGWTPYFPVPADLVVETGNATPYAFRMRPVAIDGSTDLGNDHPVAEWLQAPAAVQGKVEQIRGWVECSHLAEYLAGTLPPPRGLRFDDLQVTDPVCAEERVGLALEPGVRSARSGLLYQTTHLRLADDWAYLTQCQLPGGWARAASGPVPFGGRGRLADVEPAPGVGWPASPTGFPGGRVLAYVATPAIWPEGWRLPLPAGARLIAAAIGQSQAVATTSPRNGWKSSRALRWAVPAGSVYLLRFDSEHLAQQWSATVHGTAYRPPPESLDTPAGEPDTKPKTMTGQRLRTAGFGVVLTGVWA
jgi:CRISPR type III-B/RAMP module-associated protein Cmr3